MTLTDYNTATPLRATLLKIDDAQAKIAVSGSKVKIEVIDSAGSVVVSKDAIIAAIGGTAYNTLIASSLTALNTALTGAETTANTSLAAL